MILARVLRPAKLKLEKKALHNNKQQISRTIIYERIYTKSQKTIRTK